MVVSVVGCSWRSFERGCLHDNNKSPSIWGMY